MAYTVGLCLNPALTRCPGLSDPPYIALKS